MEQNPGVSFLPRIIHEDAFLLVIEKPAGMPSVSLKEGERNTLTAWILERFPGQAKVGDGAREAGLVNRLDNDTSGIVVAARSEEARAHLRRQFREGKIKKEYAALVLGSPPEEGDIESPLAHHPRKKKKMVVCMSLGEAKKLKARMAQTSYRVTQRFGTEYSLLCVTIATGLRHQIRLHLSSIGHPIAGDKLYRNPKMRAADTLSLSRHFLHASRLVLIHPDSGDEMEFSSPLPEDLSSVLSRLRP